MATDKKLTELIEIQTPIEVTDLMYIVRPSLGTSGSKFVPVANLPSGGTWGNIIGTLSNQTDLQNVLDAKANLSGATFSGTINVSQITLGVGYLDVGIARNASGVLEINNGTAGQFRDLKARALTLSTALSIANGGTAATNAADARTNLGLGTAAVLTAGAANGAATLDGSGKLASAQIPDISVVQYLGAVNSQNAMLALTGQQGDWCTRTDLGTNWIITGNDPTLIGNWTQLSYPTAPVTSVFGRTGGVIAVSTDYSSVGITNTAIGATNPSTGAFTSLSLRNATASGQSLTGSADTSIIDLSTTWNTTGTPTAIKLNITDTASNENSLLMDLQVGGSSKFAVDKNGKIVGPLTVRVTGSPNNIPSLVVGASTTYSDDRHTVIIANSANSETSIVRAQSSGGYIQMMYENFNGATWLQTNGSQTLNLSAGRFNVIGNTAISGSSSTDLMNLTQTWNTTGTPTAIKLNITDTASNANSLLMDLQVGGDSKFKVGKNSKIVLPQIDNVGLYIGTSNVASVYYNNWWLYFQTPSANLRVMGMGENSVWFDQSVKFGYSINNYPSPLTGNNNIVFGYASSSGFDISNGLSGGSKSYRDLTLRTLSATAGTIALDTPAINASATWNSSVTITGGSTTGSVATFTFAAMETAFPVGSVITVAGVNPTDYRGYNGNWVVTASTTTSVSFACSQPTAWISGGTISQLFTGIKQNITDTASSPDSRLLDLQVAGTSKFWISKSGQLNINSTGYQFQLSGSGLSAPYGLGSAYLLSAPGGFADAGLTSNGFVLNKIWFGPVNGFNPSGAVAGISRDATGTIAFRLGDNSSNGTIAHTIKVYNTWTSSGANYERLGFNWTTNVAQLYTEAGGTGISRDLVLGTNATTAISINGTSQNVTVSNNLTVNGSITTGTSLGVSYTSLTDAGGGIAYKDTVSASGCAVYEVIISGNPDAATSASLLDFVYGKIIIGTGWNGSAAIDYVSYVQENPDPRSLYNSSGSNLSVTIKLVSSGTEYDSLPQGTAYTLRVKISGYNSSYSGNNTTIRLKRIM